MSRVFWLIWCPFLVAMINPAKAIDLSAVLAKDGLSLNGVVAGAVKENRATFSLAGFVQVLGAPDRIETVEHTRRITWDDAGIQLETTARENAPFATLFQFSKPNITNQGVVPSGQYSGTLDCLGIRLQAGKPVEDRKGGLTSAGFSREVEAEGIELWSLRLEHWAVFLTFTGDGTIDSVVIRTLPDIF